jgi:predicted outer membrane lipoprotein
MKKFILNHFEGIIIFFIAIISTYFFFKYFLIEANLIYMASNLNPTFIGLFGGLLGLLLTAYAIVFGIVPALNKELLESDSFLRINRTFFVAVILTLLLLISSILYEFVGELSKQYLLGLYFFLFSIVLMEIILVAIILFLLLKISRKKILSE